MNDSLWKWGRGLFPVGRLGYIILSPLLADSGLKFHEEDGNRARDSGPVGWNASPSFFATCGCG